MKRVLILLLLIPGLPLYAAEEEAGAETGTVTGREVPLPLPRAISLALAHNLEVEVARTGPLAARERVGQSLGAFDPLGYASYGFDHQETPVASSVQSAFSGGLIERIDEDAWDYETGINGQLPFGLQYGTTYNLFRTNSSSGFLLLDPEWRPVWSSGVTLPLLRNLIHNEANVRVKRARIAEQISEENFRALLTLIVQTVEGAYWELASSRAAEQVAQKSLKTAQDLLDQTRVQYEVGVVSKVLVTQAEAGVAEREVNVIRAENRTGNAQDALLNAIAAPDPAEYASTTLLPDDPTYVEYVIDEEVAISRAMRHRPELVTSRRLVEDAEVQLAFARNQRLPKLDVTANYTLSGLSGDQKTLDLDGDGNPDPPLPLSFETDSSGAHRDFFRASGAHGWGVAARVEIPFGNRTARHRVFEREIDLRRARTDLKRVEQVVILEVRGAARALRSAIEALQAAERRRVAQEETLRAEQERLRLGDSTPFQVLEFEEDLAEAENQEIAALQVYRNSIVGLEQSQGTLLESRRIELQDEIER